MKLPVFVKRLIYGGSSRLSATEVAILDAARAKLSPAEASAVSEQIRDIETVQKHAGRVVTIFYRSDARAARLPVGEYCLAKLRLEEAGRKSSVAIWAYDGRLSSLEYSRRPSKVFSVLSCEIRPSKVISVAAAIDRHEHPHENGG